MTQIVVIAEQHWHTRADRLYTARCRASDTDGGSELGSEDALPLDGEPSP